MIKKTDTLYCSLFYFHTVDIFYGLNKIITIDCGHFVRSKVYKIIVDVYAITNHYSCDMSSSSIHHQ